MEAFASRAINDVDAFTSLKVGPHFSELASMLSHLGGQGVTRRLSVGVAAIAATLALFPIAEAQAEQTVLLKPIGDTFVSAARPSSNFEGRTLRAGAKPVQQSLLRFRLSELPSDAIVESAILRLAVSSRNGSLEAGEIHTVSGTWRPTTVTWSSRPALGPKVADLTDPATAGSHVSADVTDTVLGDGTFDFYVTSGSSDSVTYGALESPAAEPLLSITYSTDSITEVSTKTIESSPSPEPETQPSAPPRPSQSVVKAFPSAEGFGQNSVGGRGGRVIQVTNLNDAGPGSLRAALEASGPRIVVFRTGGTIEVQSKIKITNPYVTVAGQSAPGGGIAIKASPEFSGGPLAVENTHDVIVRHIRVRPGPSTIVSAGRDGIEIQASHDVILDHVSVSWATDENVTLIDGTHDVTVQWSIISEGLDDSTHAEGEHSKGLLISGKNYKSTEQTRNITVHHNLFAHNRRRNPRNAAHGLVDVVNNVAYDYGDQALNASDLQARITSNVVNNYFKPGPSTSGVYEVTHSEAGGYGFELYVSGNIGPHRTQATQPDTDVVDPKDRSYVVTTRFPAPSVAETSAVQAYADVLAGAGARRPVLDAVDKRIVSEVSQGTGSIIDDPAEVGGWPSLLAGTPPVDSDQDGMADSWESAHSLNPRDPSDGPAIASNGYTNVENYLNELAADPI